MTHWELREHAGYFRDRAKLDAYQQAISTVVRPGDVVVDLGAGTGLLGLMAARAGAGRVYLIEERAILGAALEMFRANGFADRCIPVSGRSVDVILPESADVVLCDQIGGLVYDAGVLDYFADAAQRFMGPDGTLVPAGFSVHAAPVRAPELREAIDLWATTPGGFDTSVLHNAAVNTEWRADTDVSLVEPGLKFAEMESSALEPARGRLAFELSSTGVVDGFAGWFRAELCPGVTLSNEPGLPGRMDRWFNFYPLPRPIEAHSGDLLEIELDVRPALPAVSWNVDWSREGRRLDGWRQSTLLGMFIQPIGLSAGNSASTARPMPARDAVVEALSALGGELSIREIVDEVAARHSAAFSSDRRAHELLTAELHRWSSGRW